MTNAVNGSNFIIEARPNVSVSTTSTSTIISVAPSTGTFTSQGNGFIIPIIVAFAIVVIIGLLIPDTARCPKCGLRMEPYDDKRDVCNNPKCPSKT